MSATTAHILAEANALPLGELEYLIANLSEIRASKISQSTLSSHERELLQEINASVPLYLRKRWQELIQAQQEHLLIESEKEELTNLVNDIEEREGKRLMLLSELAKLRGVTILQLVETLGLRPRDQNGD
jgi:hypothetical protein